MLNGTSAQSRLFSAIISSSSATQRRALFVYIGELGVNNVYLNIYGIASRATLIELTRNRIKSG